LGLLNHNINITHWSWFTRQWVINFFLKKKSILYIYIYIYIYMCVCVCVCVPPCIEVYLFLSIFILILSLLTSRVTTITLFINSSVFSLFPGGNHLAYIYLESKSKRSSTTANALEDPLQLFLLYLDKVYIYIYIWIRMLFYFGRYAYPL
jgi:hypothetical protein